MNGNGRANGHRPLGSLAAQADATRSLAHDVLVPACPDCGRPGGMGCTAVPGPPLLLLGQSLSGPLYAHESRVEAAAEARPRPDQVAFLSRVIDAFPVIPAPVPPAPPAPPADAHPDLWWTTVRPDQAPAATGRS
jgi:hypothetical protein